MTTTPTTGLVDLIEQNADALLKDWVSEQERATTRRASLLSSEDLQADSREFLGLLRETLRTTSSDDLEGPGWSNVRDHLQQLSRRRAEEGFSPSETATFVFSLKQPLFVLLGDELSSDPRALTRAIWEATVLLDGLGLLTTEESQRAREAVIARQQRELTELSTPVVKLWDGVLAVPLIGTLDSERTQVVMETLLQGIVDTNSTMAIIDITGVPTVDTLVAQHLLKTVAAARLMGADCIISGIRPQIAQTIVHLGLTLSEVTTKATMADAIAVAFERTGIAITRAVDS
jgi:rsbT co-antagonist protein RsbR